MEFSDLEKLLIEACEKEDIKEAKMLIKSGVNVRNILRHQIDMGNIDALKILIKAGANVDLRDSQGKTALIYAVMLGRTEIARILIDKGAEIDIQDAYGKTALMYAVILRRTEIVQILIDKGAEIDIRDAYGKTALMYACELRCIEIVQILKTAGADVRTALIYEIKMGDTRAVERLLEKKYHMRNMSFKMRSDIGIEIEVREKLENYPYVKYSDLENIIEVLEEARKYNYIDEIKTLIENEENREKDYISSILEIEACRKNDIDKIIKLIEDSSYVWYEVDNTILSIPVYKEDNRESIRELIRELIKNGADVNAVSENNGTLLKSLMHPYESREDYIEYMAMLIEGGVYKEDILEEVERIDNIGDKGTVMYGLDIIIEGIKRESYNLSDYIRKVMTKRVTVDEIRRCFKRVNRLDELCKTLKLRKYKSNEVKKKIFSNIDSNLLNRVIVQLLRERLNASKEIIDVPREDQYKGGENMLGK